MKRPIIYKFLFTVTFPVPGERCDHVPGIKLHSLARNQLSDLDIIETIDHLFSCHGCFETYRHVRRSYCRPVMTRSAR